jgi:uncharacterized protein (TIGR03435 family)
MRTMGVRRTLAVVTASAVTMACFAVRAQTANAGDLTGNWQGTLEGVPAPSNQGQRIVLKVAKAGGSHQDWHGVAYEIDDKTYGYEGRDTTQMSFAGGVVRFAIGPMGLTYEGRLSVDGQSIAGQWRQGGQVIPLTLARVNAETAWAIPEEAKAMALNADPDWEVVTVRPADPNQMNSGFQFHGRDVEVQRKTVESMLLICCGMHKSQIVNAPDWIRSEVWDAKGFASVPGQPNVKQFQSMLRKLVAERFGLKYHTEQKELSVYALKVGKGGPKLAPSAGDPNGIPNENDSGNGVEVTMHAENMTMGELSLMMKLFMDRPVVDQTGLTGRYDFQLKWTTDESKAPTDGSAPPTIFTAVQEQLGLKLEAVKAMTDVMVIDKVERPGEN